MAGVQTKIDHIKLWLLYNLSVNNKKKYYFLMIQFGKRCFIVLVLHQNFVSYDVFFKFTHLVDQKIVIHFCCIVSNKSLLSSNKQTLYVHSANEGCRVHFVFWIYYRNVYRSCVSYLATFQLLFFKKCFKGNAKLMICYCGELSYWKLEICSYRIKHMVTLQPYVDFYIQ